MVTFLVEQPLASYREDQEPKEFDMCIMVCTHRKTGQNKRF